MIGISNAQEKKEIYTDISKLSNGIYLCVNKGLVIDIEQFNQWNHLIDYIVLKSPYGLFLTRGETLMNYTMVNGIAYSGTLSDISDKVCIFRDKHYRGYAATSSVLKWVENNFATKFNKAISLLKSGITASSDKDTIAIMYSDYIGMSKTIAESLYGTYDIPLFESTTLNLITNSSSSTDPSIQYKYRGLLCLYKIDNQDGYTPLSYLMGDAKSYIDLGFKPNQNTKIIAQVTSWKEFGTGVVYGSQTTNTSNAFYFYTTTDSHVVGFGTQKNTSSYDSYGSFQIQQDKTSTRIAGSTVASNTSVAAFESPSNLLLFAMGNANGVPSSYSKCRIHSMKCYDNRTLIRDLVPMLRIEDGVPGMYDKVNKVFYTNQGTGYFLYA